GSRLPTGYIKPSANLGATQHVMVRDPRHSLAAPFAKPTIAESTQIGGIAHAAERFPQRPFGIEGYPFGRHQYSSASMRVRTLVVFSGSAGSSEPNSHCLS